MQRFLQEKWNLIIVLIILGAFWAGLQVGAESIPAIEKISLANKETPTTIEEDFTPFWKAWNSINEKYPTASEITDRDKIYGAISGLVDSLNDPYSVFFGPEEAKSFEEEIAGNFSGVGMEVGMKENILTVIAPLKDTPAHRANIKPGDQILKIDETVTANLSMEEAIKLIRGERGTTVTLTISRDGNSEPIEVKIVRDVINIPTLDTELRPDGIFVIKLYSFSAISSDLFREAMKIFAESGTDKLLLDLRSNPGGYLTAAVNISSWFLPTGTVIVTEDYGGNNKPEIFRSKGYDVFNDKLKFVILIDDGSASASEILAGAMQDHKRATLVGSQSFGKGSIQEVVKITPDTLLKITVAQWLTPNGNLIEGEGLTPDHVVENTKEDLENEKDPQLEKAVEVLLH